MSFPSALLFKNGFLCSREFPGCLLGNLMLDYTRIKVSGGSSTAFPSPGPLEIHTGATPPCWDGWEIPSRVALTRTTSSGVPSPQHSTHRKAAGHGWSPKAARDPRSPRCQTPPDSGSAELNPHCCFSPLPCPLLPSQRPPAGQRG